MLARVPRHAEAREDVRVVPAEPVAEARAEEGLVRGPGGAEDHVVLAVEEVGRVAGVGAGPGGEAGERGEGRGRPLPAVPDELLHPPRARAFGVAARGERGPAEEAEVAVARLRRGVAPGVGAQAAVGGREGGAAELGLGGEAATAGGAVGARLEAGHLHGPAL